RGRPSRFSGWACSRLASAGGDLLLRGPKQAFALRLLASELASPPDGIRLFARALFGGLLIGGTTPHFTIVAFSLHLLREDAKGLVDVVLADKSPRNTTACAAMTATSWVSFEPKRPTPRLSHRRPASPVRAVQTTLPRLYPLQ